MLNQPEGNETFSILAIDIGSAYTRALLFNDVDGQYHFIAEGLSVTSTFDPICNVNEGMFQAIQQLQIMTGALLLDEDYHLIIPSQPDGAGVDRLVVTFSAGAEVKTATIGLLKEFSLQAANDLAKSTYAKIVEQISSNDQRTVEKQMNAVVHAEPDLFIFTGGMEDGASNHSKNWWG